MRLENVPVFWAHVQEPNKFNCYSIDVVLGDREEEIMAALAAGGVTHLKPLDNNDERGRYLTFRKDVMDHNKRLLRRPAVVDAQAKPLTTKVDIGNGSICNIDLFLRKTKDFSTGAAMTKPDLAGVQIVELVEYDPDGDGEPVNNFDAVDGGYIAPDAEPEDAPEVEEDTAAYQ